MKILEKKFYWMWFFLLSCFCSNLDIQDHLLDGYGIQEDDYVSEPHNIPRTVQCGYNSLDFLENESFPYEYEENPHYNIYSGVNQDVSSSPHSFGDVKGINSKASRNRLATIYEEDESRRPMACLDDDKNSPYIGRSKLSRYYENIAADNIHTHSSVCPSDPVNSLDSVNAFTPDSLDSIGSITPDSLEDLEAQDLGQVLTTKEVENDLIDSFIAKSGQVQPDEFLQEEIKRFEAAYYDGNKSKPSYLECDQFDTLSINNEIETLSNDGLTTPRKRNSISAKFKEDAKILTRNNETMLVSNMPSSSETKTLLNENSKNSDTDIQNSEEESKNKKVKEMLRKIEEINKIDSKLPDRNSAIKDKSKDIQNSEEIKKHDMNKHSMNAKKNHEFQDDENKFRTNVIDGNEIPRNGSFSSNSTDPLADLDELTLKLPDYASDNSIDISAVNAVVDESIKIIQTFGNIKSLIQNFSLALMTRLIHSDKDLLEIINKFMKEINSIYKCEAFVGNTTRSKENLKFDEVLSELRRFNQVTNASSNSLESSDGRLSFSPNASNLTSSFEINKETSEILDVKFPINILENTLSEVLNLQRKIDLYFATKQNISIDEERKILSDYHNILNLFKEIIQIKFISQNRNSTSSKDISIYELLWKAINNTAKSLKSQKNDKKTASLILKPDCRKKNHSNKYLYSTEENCLAENSDNYKLNMEKILNKMMIEKELNRLCEPFQSKDLFFLSKKRERKLPKKKM